MISKDRLTYYLVSRRLAQRTFPRVGDQEGINDEGNGNKCGRKQNTFNICSTEVLEKTERRKHLSIFMGILQIVNDIVIFQINQAQINYGGI